MILIANEHFFSAVTITPKAPLTSSSPFTSTIQPSRSTLSQPQPPVPSSNKPSVPESTKKSSSQNLVIYGAIGGVIGLILIVTTVCFIVICKKNWGVVTISLQDNIQTKGNEAYSTHLTSLAVPTAQNEAYSAVQPAYIDEGYVVNQLIYEEPSAVETKRNNIPVIPTAQNEAYGAVGSGGGDIEYDYVTQ